MSATLKGTTPAQFGLHTIRMVTPPQWFALWGATLGTMVFFGSKVLVGLNGKVPRWILYSDRVPEQKVIDEAKVSKWNW